MTERNQESILDIVSEMREFADTDSQTIGRDVLRKRIQDFARRIEQSVTDCNRIGNIAKILEALEQIHLLLGIKGKPDTAMCIRYEAAYQIAKEALFSTHKRETVTSTHLKKHFASMVHQLRDIHGKRLNGVIFVNGSLQKQKEMRNEQRKP